MRDKYLSFLFLSRMFIPFAFDAFPEGPGPDLATLKKTGVNGKNRRVEKPFVSLYGTLPSISIIFATSEHTGQDFFLSENKSLNNSNPERAIIIPNATIKMNANGRPGQGLHEDKKRRRYISYRRIK